MNIDLLTLIVELGAVAVMVSHRAWWGVAFMLLAVANNVSRLLPRNR